MKLRDKTFILTATLALAALIIVMVKKEQEKKQEMLDTIADEGYETAQDILYPLKPSRLRRLYSGYGY